MARLARDRRRTGCASGTQFQQIAEEIRKAGFHARVAARHGRIEPLRGSFGADVRQDCGLSAKFTCSIPPIRRKSAPLRIEARSRENDFHRSEQVRQHARAEHFQAIFLRARETGCRCGRGGKAFHCRSPIPARNMQKVAEAGGFRHIFFGLPSIGGRYSALSDFGMIPGAIQGIDVAKFLDRAEEMVHACGASAVPADENPGAILGAISGRLQKWRPRQSDDLRVAWNFGSGRVARTTARRIHGQRGPRPDSG